MTEPEYNFDRTRIQYVWRNDRTGRCYVSHSMAMNDARPDDTITAVTATTVEETQEGPTAWLESESGIRIGEIMGPAPSNPQIEIVGDVNIDGDLEVTGNLRVTGSVNIVGSEPEGEPPGSVDPDMEFINSRDIDIERVRQAAGVAMRRNYQNEIVTLGQNVTLSIPTEPGQRIIVVNRGDEICRIYPALSTNLGEGINEPMSLDDGASITFIAIQVPAPVPFPAPAEAEITTGICQWTRWRLETAPEPSSNNESYDNDIGGFLIPSGISDRLRANLYAAFAKARAKKRKPEQKKKPEKRTRCIMMEDDDGK